MKKIFRRLFIAAAVTFVVLSLFSCTTESVTDTRELDYNREMLSDVWIYDGSPNERIEKTINIDGTFQEHFLFYNETNGFRQLIKSGNWAINSDGVITQSWENVQGDYFTSSYSFTVTLETLTVGDLTWRRK